MLGIVARQQFPSPAIDFQADLSQNCNLATQEHSPVSNSIVYGPPMVEQTPSRRQDSGVNHHLPETPETPPL
jgi:hypothetical protein